jgi:hypothetical protein
MISSCPIDVISIVYVDKFFDLKEYDWNFSDEVNLLEYLIACYHAIELIHN